MTQLDANEERTCNAMRAAAQWPALMAYIYDRNELEKSAWCTRLREDEAKARAGEFADVAREMELAKAAYGETQRAAGLSDYPYNEPMGLFLGLEINPGNHEPRHGYYMANSIASAFRYGVARRAVESFIAAGTPLKIVAARSKATRAPVRFYTFRGPAQIVIDGRGLKCTDGKRTVRLSSNWSEETCLENVRKVMETGTAYGA